MKKRQWHVRRCAVTSADAQSRWDRSYQYLVQWSAVVLSDSPMEPLSQEKDHESGRLCARLDPTSGPGSDD